MRGILMFTASFALSSCTIASADTRAFPYTIGQIWTYEQDKTPGHGRKSSKIFYSMKVVRKDKVLKWYIDGKLFMDYYDSDPLKGEEHDRLALNNWQSRLYFDNIEIRKATPEDK